MPALNPCPGKTCPSWGSMHVHAVTRPVRMPRERPSTPPPRTRAVARSSDPSTSWEAARSVGDLRETQRIVLAALTANGPMTDEALYLVPDVGRAMSVSGARTRRSELVDLGMVEDTGQRARLASGRRSIVWRVKE